MIEAITILLGIGLATLLASKTVARESKPQTHDYTRRTWGRDFTFTPRNGGQRGTMIGWGEGINTGDYLILPHNNATTRYKIERIDYYADPPDMWRAEVVFAPRTSNNNC